MRLRSVGPIVAVLVFLIASGVSAGAPSAAPTVSRLQLFDQHIDHIVFLMQENHAFDSIFGDYCPATGRYCPDAVAGLPAGTCLPLNLSKPTGACLAPYNFTAAQESPKFDLPHNWYSSHVAWNNGSMNGFYPAELDSREALGHYNGTTAPVYWDLAEQYGLADDFFSSALSYSLPNHWYLVASKAPSVTYKVRLLGSGVTASEQTTYLNESNATPTIEGELANSSVSWAYFDYALGAYNRSIDHAPAGPAYDYWNPLESRAQSYTASVVSHFQNRSQFFGDAANGTLPDVSWIIPAAQNSDHPPYNITSGQDWVAQVVDALELSPEWNSTVLFVSWDEYGGFYDHVAPPQLDAYGDGFRVPLLAIGPWVKQGYVDPTEMDFSSILHLIEERFGLTCLGPRDCDAKLPLDMFDFQKGPRAPIEITPYGTAVYPMPLESSGKLPYYGLSEGAAPVAYHEPPPVPLALLEDPQIDWS